MKATIHITLAALGLLLLAGCASTGGSSGVKPYPFDTCIVTDNELGSMGDPITINHEGQEVKFCCSPCVRKFEKNPAKYLAQLE